MVEKSVVLFLAFAIEVFCFPIHINSTISYKSLQLSSNNGRHVICKRLCNLDFKQTK